MKTNFLTLKIKSLLVVAPEKPLLNKIEDAFKLIQKTDKKEYKNLFKRLDVIFITNKNGYTNEFFMPEKIWFANKSVVRKNDLNWLASLIIHECFHSTQFKNGKYILPLDKLEKPALNLQEKFLAKLDGGKSKKDIKSVIEKKYWREMDDDKKSFSYFRNLLNLLKNKKLKF